MARSSIPLVLTVAVATACGTVPHTQAPLAAGSPATAATATAAASPAQAPSRSPDPAPSTPTRVEGIDVSAYQPRVDWTRWAGTGVRFVWIKATEGATWRSPTFASQRSGARAAGLLHGAYHYARPSSSTGAVQARFFVANGGGWTADGRTLPGALDLEKSPGAEHCHSLSTREMVGWIRDFTTEYRRLAGRDAVIYVQADWWGECTDGEESFAATNPLWLYDHDPPLGPLPAGWDRPTAWQYGTRQSMDRNAFLGTEADLRAWAATP